MKKFLSFFIVAFVALASQANELTVYDGTSTNGYIPVRSYYYDTEGYKSQFILPADQFTTMQGAFVNSMKFYISNANGNEMEGGKLAVMIGTTDQTSYGWSASYITGLTQVAEITMTPGDPELVIDFDEPWFYEGGNIVIGTTVVEAGNCPYVYFYGETASVNNGAYGSASVSTTSFYPKTTFTYEGGSDDMASVNVKIIDFGNLFLEQTATKTFTLKNLGKNAFTPVFGGLQAPFSIAPAAAEIAAGASVEYTVTFAPAAIGEYAQTLTIDCGDAGLFEIPVAGACVEMPAEIVVCDGTSTSGSVPVYAYYYDQASHSQMIYGAEELAALNGKKITSVTFHADRALGLSGGEIQMSFKPVEESGFSSYDLLTDFTVVATAVPDANSTELTFVLDQPYEYNGGNLAIDVLVTVKSNYSSAKFYGKSVSNNASLCYYGNYNSSSIEKFLPKATIGYQKEETPQPEWRLGDVNHDNAVDVADVTLMISYILGLNPDGFYTTEANCDGAGSIDVSDVTALINMILNQ